MGSVQDCGKLDRSFDTPSGQTQEGHIRCKECKGYYCPAHRDQSAHNCKEMKRLIESKAHGPSHEAYKPLISLKFHGFHESILPLWEDQAWPGDLEAIECTVADVNAPTARQDAASGHIKKGHRDVAVVSPLDATPLSNNFQGAMPSTLLSRLGESLKCPCSPKVLDSSTEVQPLEPEILGAEAAFNRVSLQMRSDRPICFIDDRFPAERQLARMPSSGRAETYPYPITGSRLNADMLHLWAPLQSLPTKKSTRDDLAQVSRRATCEVVLRSLSNTTFQGNWLVRESLRWRDTMLQDLAKEASEAVLPKAEADSKPQKLILM